MEGDHRFSLAASSEQPVSAGARLPAVLAAPSLDRAEGGATAPPPAMEIAERSDPAGTSADALPAGKNKKNSPSVPQSASPLVKVPR